VSHAKMWKASSIPEWVNKLNRDALNGYRVQNNPTVESDTLHQIMVAAEINLNKIPKKMPKEPYQVASGSDLSVVATEMDNLWEKGYVSCHLEQFRFSGDGNWHALMIHWSLA